MKRSPRSQAVTLDQPVDDELLAACGEGRLTPAATQHVEARLTPEQRAALRDVFPSVFPSRRRPWDASRSGFEDTTRRRIAVRMAYLGMTHAEMGARLSDGGVPLTGATVRAYLSGRRAWRLANRGSGRPDPIDRFARALEVGVVALEPGGPWADLVGTP